MLFCVFFVFFAKCVFRRKSDRIPILFGQGSDPFRTLFRFNSDSVPRLFGQFSGTVGTVSEMGRNDPVGGGDAPELASAGPFEQRAGWHEKLHLCVKSKTYSD